MYDIPKVYDLNCEWIVETTYGYYHERLYGICQLVNNKEEGIKNMKFWYDKGYTVRLYNNKTGEIIYPNE